jgi:hypothetical protein
MKTSFDILKRDPKGTFHWIEATRDLRTAETRVRQLCAESTEEFVIFRQVDLQVVATSGELQSRQL